MTTPPNTPPTWRDILYTLELAAAQGIARDALRESRARPKFNFALEAAATKTEFEVDGASRLDISRMLELQSQVTRDEIWLTFIARGYRVMSLVAGRRAQLTSRNAKLVAFFEFDANGQGQLILTDEPEVRAALWEFTVSLLPAPGE